MDLAVTVVLVVPVVLSLVASPFRRYAAPIALICGAIGVGSSVVPRHLAVMALRALGFPLAFVLFAVPLSVLLDRYGLFEAIAQRVSQSSHLRGGLWVLAAIVTATLNLDASVVLLTPLYVRIAEQQHRSRLSLCIQPALLAGLASSALPISNLTNLIVQSRLQLSPLAFVEHEGLVTLVTVAVGFAFYAVSERKIEALEPVVSKEGARRSPERLSRFSLGVGLGFTAAVVAGFVVSPYLGGQPFEVAAAADVLLCFVVGLPGWKTLPWQSIAVVLGLGVLAAGLGHGLDVAAMLSVRSPVGLMRTVGVFSLASDLLNNLPALLTALAPLASHRSAAYAVLVGTNVGSLFVPWGSLSGLLWLETVRRLGVTIHERDYIKIAWRVALPSLLAGMAMLFATRALS